MDDALLASGAGSAQSFVGHVFWEMPAVIIDLWSRRRAIIYGLHFLENAGSCY